MGRDLGLTPDEPYQPAGADGEELDKLTRPWDSRQKDRSRESAPRARCPGMGMPQGYVKVRLGGNGKKVRGEAAIRRADNYLRAVEEGTGGRVGAERNQDVKEIIRKTIESIETGAPVPKSDIERIVLLGLLECMDQHRIPTRLQAARMLGETVGMFKKVQISETPQGIMEQLERLERSLGQAALPVEAEVRRPAAAREPDTVDLVRSEPDHGTRTATPKKPKPAPRDRGHTKDT